MLCYSDFVLQLSLLPLFQCHDHGIIDMSISPDARDKIPNCLSHHDLLPPSHQKKQCPWVNTRSAPNQELGNATVSD